MSGKEKGDLGLESMFKLKSSENLLFRSFGIFLPKKTNILKCLCFFIISAVAAFIIGFSLCTVDAVKSVIETFITVFIGLLGVTFTGYAFFQALITGKLIEILIDTPNEKKKENKFSEMNESFVELMLLYIFFLTLNVMLKILLSSVDNNFKLFHDVILDNVFATVCILVYIYCSLVAIWHVKSYVYNVFQAFNLHAIGEYIESKKK
ncbi:hypothetical protein [Blautia massiliensis (ex Liu et al. 2021)]|uniref:hypothetical protein n=1 Tax=Blautia massiliensis (ex Liu et al. 2021) TaxID=3062492 RepID=UPI003F8A9359